MSKNKLNSILESVCATCLSQDRKLYPARNSNHFAICFPDLFLSEYDQVCWECRQIVMRMAAFRSRVLHAQATLADLLNGKLHDIKSLSGLSLLGPYIDIDISHDDVKIELELVKKEVDTLTCDVEVKCETNSDHMGNEETEPNNTTPVIPNLYVQNQLKMRETEDTNSNCTCTRSTNKELPVSQTPDNQKEKALLDAFNPDFTHSDIMTKEEILAWRKRKENIEFNTSNTMKCEKCLKPFENLTFCSNNKMYAETLSPHTPSEATLERATPKPGPSKRPACPNLGPSKSRRKIAVSPTPGPTRAGGIPPDFQIDELDNSGSEPEFDQSSGDEDEVSARVGDMRLAARKLRELRILQEESSGRAVEEFLQEAGVAELDDEQGFGDFVETSEQVGEASAKEASGPARSSFSWSEDFSSFSGQEEKYIRTPGPKITSVDPLDIFLNIWDASILSEIAQQTNQYAWEVIVGFSERGAVPKNLDAWVETSVEEIRCFLGILVLMSLSPKVKVDEYWSTGILGMERFRALMSRNRFRLLWRFLHFGDSDTITSVKSTCQKRIGRITPVIEHLNSKFSSMYTPERALFLDESLFLWKRLNWVQCIQSKAARFGIKSVELCEASSGYMLRCMLYVGKSSFVHSTDGFENKTAKVVELMDGFLDIGHLIVMDNWYNQLYLTRFLKSRRTDALGTMKRNRAFVPTELQNADQKRMRPGEQISRHCGDISITTWKDFKLLTIVSTIHKDDQASSHRTGETSKPLALQDYNKTVSGVHLRYTRLKAYAIQHRRSYEWYKKAFFYLLNTSILNAYIIYQKNSVTPLSHRAFRYKLAEDLVAHSARAPVAMHRLNNSPRYLRLDGRDHYPVLTEAVIGKIIKHSRRRCVRCKAKGKRSQVVTMCGKCDVPLCIDKCFIEYHTLK